MNKLKIAVLFGGRSGEHEVSLVSATSIIGALDKKKYEIIPIGITKTGKWVAGKNVMESLKKGKTAGLDNVSLSLDPAQKGVFIYNDKDDECEFKKVDIVFPVLHGPYGEDGTVQGMLEIASIPYVG
ncbi:MAG: D-alanine--D-alanine ligase A, partial [Candidatus Gracilibacteria bacterium]